MHQSAKGPVEMNALQTVVNALENSRLYDITKYSRIRLRKADM